MNTDRIHLSRDGEQDRRDQAYRYLSTLYRGVAHGGSAGIVGGHLGSEKWVPAEWRTVPAELDKLTEDALRRATNAYININPMAGKPQRGKRGTASEVIARVGFVADFDLNGPGHKGDKARPSTEAEVWAALTEAGLEPPTMAVRTGGGVHAYWLLAEAVELSESSERETDSRRAERFQGALDAAYDAAGWDEPDNVSDLPRVLRVPGTARTKPDAPDPLDVQLLFDDGPRFSLDDIDAMAGIEADGEGITEADGQGWQSIALDNIERGDDYGSVLADQIRQSFEERLAQFNGPYLSGRRNQLRDAALWAGAREAVLADAGRRLYEAAQAGGVVARRGHRHVVELITSGLELGRRTPYRPPARLVREELDRRTPYRPPAPEAGDASRGTSPAPHGRPMIVVNGRQFRDVERDVIAALRQLNGRRPRLFDRGGELVAVSRESRARPVGEAGLQSWTSEAADFYSSSERNGDRPTAPPRDVLRALAARDAAELGVPALDAFTTVPILRPDGSLHTEPGYDSRTRTYYSPINGEMIDSVPMEPDAAELDKARTLLLDTWGEFPYADDASRCHALALLLTAVLRPAIEGPVPMAVFTAPTPGTGKTLLSQTILSVAEGRDVPTVALPKQEDERRKTITAQLRDGRPLFFDNVEGALSSAHLSQLLTSSEWSDRILGSSTKVNIPVRAVPAVTGNGVQIRGDLMRRVYFIELDAGTFRPELRTGFTHRNLGAHVLDRRADLIHAVLVLARAWVAAGRPEPDCPSMGSYEQWRTIVGGVLTHAGIGGFLENTAERIADPDVTEWAAFIELLETELVSGVFTSGEVAQAIEARPAMWRSIAPAGIVAKFGRPELPKVIGEAFAQRAGRRWTESGLRLERSAARGRANVTRWTVVRDPEPEPPSEPAEVPLLTAEVPLLTAEVPLWGPGAEPPSEPAVIELDEEDEPPLEAYEPDPDYEPEFSG